MFRFLLSSAADTWGVTQYVEALRDDPRRLTDQVTRAKESDFF